VSKYSRLAAAICTVVAAISLTACGNSVRPIQAHTASYTGQPICPVGTTCVREKVIIQDPESDTPNQFLVEDKNRAPMFWVNLGGAASGGEPVCVVNLHLSPIACIGGPWGNYGGQPVLTLYSHGKAYSLTAKDITWIHSHGG
jgi:hypothetical protein